MTLSESLLFYTSGSHEFFIVDLTDPSVPAVLSNLSLPSRGHGLAARYNYVYVATDAGLSILEVSDPSDPILLGSVDLPGSPEGIDILDYYACVAADNVGVVIVDVHDPTNPVEVARLSNAHSATSVAAGTEYVFVGASPSDMTVIFCVDVRAPGRPRILGDVVVSPSRHAAIAAQGGNAYVADYYRALRVVSSEGSTVPVPVGVYDNYYIIDARVVKVAGSVAYLLASGLVTIDVTDPTFPAELARLGLGHPEDLALSDTLALVATNHEGLAIVGVGDPESPSVLGFVDLPGAEAVATVGSLACVAASFGGLQLVDFEDPYNPYVVGSVQTFANAKDVAVEDDLAYVACPDSGLQVVDIADPTEPRIIASLALPSWIGRVHISDSVAYLARGGKGVTLVDVSNPANPCVISEWDTPYAAREVVRYGDYLYVADWKTGLVIIDASDPVNLLPVGQADTPGWALGLTVDGSFVYVADDDDGLSIYPIQCGTPTVDITSVIEEDHALQIISNPAQLVITIASEISKGSEVDVTIYDVLGRRIRRLFRGNSTGKRLFWDGRDENGRMVGSGVYFVRLVGPGMIESRRIVLLR
jgi:hypothetical protein